MKRISIYHKILDCCHEMVLSPFVTIYHWDLPQYWEETGGWLNEEVCTAFAQYAKVCFQTSIQKLEMGNV